MTKPFGKLLLALAAALPLVSATAQEEYTLDPTVTKIAPYTVEVVIETNLPDSAVLSVSLALKGQGPNDIFIGTDFERVTVTDGRGEVTIDGNLRSFPMGEDLPPGAYMVETNFYPTWLENREIAAEIGVNDKIEKDVEVQLGP